LKRNKMIGYFVSDQQSAYYQTATFTNVLKFHCRYNCGICL